MPNSDQEEDFWSPQNITNELLQIEPEKAHSIAECEAFVQALPSSGSVPLLRTRVEDTNRRYGHLVQLLDLAQEKWVSSEQQGGQLGSGGQASNPTPDLCLQGCCCQPPGEEPAGRLGGAGHI